MKKIILAILVGMGLVACRPTSNQAVKYNDTVIEIIDAVTKTQNNFLNQVDGHNPDSLKIVHQLFLLQAENAVKKAASIESFDNSTEFVDAAKAYISEINALAKGEGKLLVDLIATDTTDITEEEAANIQKTAEEYDAKYDKAYNEINEAQKVFSKKYGFVLLDKGGSK